ncbi:AAA family ATPase [bacterium]|nr:AAA family ATPase [bacterium]
MLVSKIMIQSFKSIKELTLPVDSKVTVLIGPNESGKTNMLKAIESFRPDVPLTLDKTCQYSDHYTEGKTPKIGIEFGGFSREEKNVLIKMYEGFRAIDSFILHREGNELTDYKIQTEDKTLAIGNIKPIIAILPKIRYYDTIPLIRDRVDLDSLLHKSEDYLTELNLLKIGAVDDPRLVFEDSTRGRRFTEETGRVITQRIREAWSQDSSLEIKLRVNGKLLYIDFSDETTVYDTPKTRSPGFLWYLSFFINFIATTNEAKPNEYLFLLDEPGTHLHPSGQKDLTTLLEGLADKNQVIYTTHSPFMINKASPQRVRVVSKTTAGTAVDNEAYRENWKPLRQSIGLTVGDLFFFSKGPIIEQPNEKGLSFKFKKKGAA